MTQSTTKVVFPYLSPGQSLDIRREGRLVTCNGIVTFGSNSPSIADGGTMTMPVGYRPRDVTGIVVYSSNDSNLNGGYVVHPDGRIRLYGMVAPSRFVLCHGSWITGDPMPEA